MKNCSFSQEKLKSKLFNAKENLKEGNSINLTIINDGTIKVENILHNLFKLTYNEKSLFLSLSFNENLKERILLLDFYAISFSKMHNFVYYCVLLD